MNAPFQRADAGRPLLRVPVVALLPHARCNCRCVMCDIWKANRTAKSMPAALFSRLADDLRALGAKEVLLSGGEALMHPGLWDLCALLKTLPVKITLLSTGLLLARHADAVTRWCDEVIVSLDGPGGTHDAIRGINGAFEALAGGIAALHGAKAVFPVSARCVVQKRNFRLMSTTLAAARDIGLDKISFLAADLSTPAFNRQDAHANAHDSEICLNQAESMEFHDLIEAVIDRHDADFRSGFIAENPNKLRRLSQYYLAWHGLGAFPPVRCAAPWVSTVIEADGTVRPCFFHEALGNVHDDDLPAILNSPKALAFRQNLDVRNNDVCSRCVCTFNP